MPVQMIEIAEVQMLQVSDDALEASAGVAFPINTLGWC